MAIWITVDAWEGKDQSTEREGRTDLTRANSGQANTNERFSLGQRKPDWKMGLGSKLDRSTLMLNGARQT